MYRIPIYSHVPANGPTAQGPHYVGKLVTTNDKYRTLSNQLTLTPPYVPPTMSREERRQERKNRAAAGASAAAAEETGSLRRHWELVDDAQQLRFSGGVEHLDPGQSTYMLLAYDEASKSFAAIPPEFLHLTPVTMQTRFHTLDEVEAHQKRTEAARERERRTAVLRAAEEEASQMQASASLLNVSTRVGRVGGPPAPGAGKPGPAGRQGGAGGARRAPGNMRETLEYAREADDEETAGDEVVDDWEQFDDQGESDWKAAVRAKAKTKADAARVAAMRDDGFVLGDDDASRRAGAGAEAEDDSDNDDIDADEEEESDDDTATAAPGAAVAAASAAAAPRPAAGSGFAGSSIARTNPQAVAAAAAAAAEEPAITASTKRARTATGSTGASAPAMLGPATAARPLTLNLTPAAAAAAATGVGAGAATAVVSGGVLTVGGRAVTAASVRSVFADRGKRDLPAQELIKALLHPASAKTASDEVKAVVRELVSAATTSRTDAATGKKFLTLN
jgi:hypothetical protein